MKNDKDYRIIDCDVHANQSGKLNHPDYLRFIPKNYHSALEMSMAGMPMLGYGSPIGVKRRDCRAESVVDIMDEHMNRYGIDIGVLQTLPGMYFSLIHSIDLANILCAAANDLLVADFLSYSPRLLGSICVNPNDPAAAAAEIRRMARNPQMAQVLVTGEAMHLYGHRSYYPIYEACVENDLVFAIHPGREGAYGSSTPVGRPSSYFEWHNILPLTFMAHANSMVLEGVFERFPTLKVLLAEGGYTWMAHLMWRMDKNFKALRVSTPWLKEAPSEYLLRHVRLTTQPIEECDNPRHVLAMLEVIQGHRTLCFSSDFPHWDFDDPLRIFPSIVPEETRRRILWDNAVELYGCRLKNYLATLEKSHEID